MMRANAAYAPNSAYSQTDEDILVAAALQLGSSGLGAIHNTVGPKYPLFAPLPVPGCDLQFCDTAHPMVLTHRC